MNIRKSIQINRVEKIDTNKQSGAVFNDFEFHPDELLSNTNNGSMFGAISNSSVRFDENNATFLFPQESVDHPI